MHEMADQWPNRVLRDALGYNPLQARVNEFKSLYQEFKTIKAI